MTTANTNTWAKPLLLLGLLGLVVAGMFALLPVSVNGIDCGSALHPVSDAGGVRDAVASLYGMPARHLQDACHDKVSGRRTWMLTLGGPAFIAVMVGFLSLPPKREDDDA